MSDSIKVRANATVANVSCGFDCLGYAMEYPSDTVIIKKNNTSGITIKMSGIMASTIPEQPDHNTAGKAILSMLNTIDYDLGFHIQIEKGISPGSGLGSSAASAAAALVGVNELLGNPLAMNELLVHGMAGEAVASGGFHADNIAPALLGGIVLIRSYDPLDIINLPVPDSLISTCILPDFEVKTMDARNMLPQRVALKAAVEQAGHLAGFTIGLFQNDFDLIGRSMVDLLAEPIRSELIPGYHMVKEAALSSNAIGCGISGSGPSLFAFSKSIEDAKNVESAMIEAFKKVGISSQGFTSSIYTESPTILD